MYNLVTSCTFPVGGSYYAEHLPLLGDLRDLPPQSEIDSSSTATIAIPSQLQSAQAQPIENIVWSVSPRTRGPITTVSSAGVGELYEESAVIDPGDRIPLTDAEGGARPNSVPAQRPRGGSGGGGAGSSRTLFADLFCAGGGSAPSEDGSVAPLGDSPPNAVAARTPTGRGRQAVLPTTYRPSTTLRLRPGAVIQLRLRSMVNENMVATATATGSEVRVRCFSH